MRAAGTDDTGQAVKEIIAEDVDGYLIVDGTIYYAQGGKIHSATSGTETAVGEESYKVQIRDGSCYLTDSLGNIVTLENGTVMEMGDRSYRLEENRGNSLCKAQRCIC